MNGDVMELKRPAAKGLADFLQEMTEEELLAELDGPMLEPRGSETSRIPSAHLTFGSDDPASELENNSRLTIIKMLEQVPDLGKPFTFYTRKFCGENYIQSIRTELARTRKWAKDNGYELAETFRMIKVSIETKPTCDVVTVMRVPKGQRYNGRLQELAKLLGGSQVEDEDDS